MRNAVPGMLRASKDAAPKKKSPTKATPVYRTPKVTAFPGTKHSLQRKQECPCDGGCPVCTGLQSKLTIGKPNDKYEQEADRVAAQVVHTRFDREEKEPVQPKPLTNNAPRLSGEKQSQIKELKGGGQPLPPATRAFFEPRFRRDLSRVRVHTGTGAAETAKSLNSRAFTIGNDVAFALGEYSPETVEGRKLMAHELTHTVQQADGMQRNDATLQKKEETPTLEEETAAITKRKDEVDWSKTSPGLVKEQTKGERFLLMNFAIESSKLKNEHEDFLLNDIYHNTLMLHPMSRIKIIGHASKTGSKKYNDKLALKRAKAVEKKLKGIGMQVLIETQVDKSEGKGFNEPIGDNSTVYGRARNRRVEIVLTPWIPAKPVDELITDLTKGMKTFNVNVYNFSDVPFPDMVKKNIEEAYSAIPIIKFNWSGTAAEEDDAIDFEANDEWGAILGVSGTIYLRSFNENEICKDEDDPSTCEKTFPDEAGIKGKAIANTAVHELAHFLGLDHVPNVDNYMWTPELHALYGKEQTYEDQILLHRTYQAIDAKFTDEQLVRIIHFIKERKKRAEENPGEVTF
ncbi:MAG: DUF4157 domain-containing protein [bacterium]|nr:DUF4157 domain-containing protein [bacterium]